MNKELWTEVDRYLAETIIQPDAAGRAVLDGSLRPACPKSQSRRISANSCTCLPG